MQKNSLHGWRKVFAFTFKENIKGTGNRVFLIVMFLLALASMPLLEAFLPDNSVPTIEESVPGSAEGEEVPGADLTEASPIKNIAFYNEAGFPMESFDDFVKNNPAFSNVKFETTDKDFKSWIEIDENNNSHYDMHVTLSTNTGGLFISCAAPTMSHLDSKDLEAFEFSFRRYINVMKLTLIGLSEEDIAALETPVNGAIYQIDENNDAVIAEDDFIWNGSEYGISYGILLVTIFLIAFAAEGISTAVLTEKSSKIIETLLLSVAPLATMVGKVLASIATLVLQFVAFFIGLFASCFLNGYLQTDSVTFLPASSMKSFLSLEMFENASPVVIIIAVAVILAGLLLYGVIAGICGASVSRMEEITEALKLYNLLYIIGAYFALAVTMVSAGGISALNYVAYLFPLSAPFITPTHLIIGKMPIWLGLCSLGLLIVLVVLAFWLASKIYVNMLFYSGKPMKIKDFISFAKNSRKEDL